MTLRKSRTRRALELRSHDVQQALWRAAHHGFAEDGETDPPGLTPSRAWVSAIYGANRPALLRRFRASQARGVPDSVSSFLLATFEADPELRAEGRLALEKHRAHWEEVRRRVAANELRGGR